MNRPETTVESGIETRGRSFFIGLLSVSAVSILALLLMYYKGDFYGKRVAVAAIGNIVAQDAFLGLLSSDFSPGQARQIQQKLAAFYLAAKQGQVPDEKLLNVSEMLKAMLADNRLTKEEVEVILNRIEEKR
ncbi:MAG TPA: hypothetical protein VNV63_04555 [Nitrospiria bacterium]|nr:hypothetical protein [Nitrospiria bacterium]